jgi:hypothetical protein
MPAERRAQLDALGLVWDVLADWWEEGFRHLQAYVGEHRHCKVPSSYVTVNGYPLGQWVQVRRRQQDSISAEQKARLDALCFVWDTPTDQWDEGFMHLEAFAKEHGHCRVPSSHVTADGYRLGRWVSAQRQREQGMPAERRARLDALGFVWDQLSAQWDEGFKHLEAFAKEQGHCRVPRDFVTADGHRLGLWVMVQRRQEDRISADRKARLDALGFVWSRKS